MNFLKRKAPQPDATGDQLAGKIAARIILWQYRIAEKMSSWANRHSRQRQKWLLAIFCALSVSGIILCQVIPFSKMAIRPGHNFQAVHIGLPSDPLIRHKHLKPTDSLTTKK